MNDFGFIKSLTHKKNEFQSFDEFLYWYEKTKTKNQFNVERLELSKLNLWRVNKETGNIEHDSGKFFKIRGLRVNLINQSKKNNWDQPIIDQPETGILGFITKEFNGIRYFLVQAKMEPGNINTIQISPTVQATKSNYTKAHKGKTPLYLDYFTEPNKAKKIFSYLQPEQGARFLHKRNKNIIVHIDEDIEVFENFKWLTLFEIKKLLKYKNIVNMDTRTIISCIDYFKEDHEASWQKGSFFENCLIDKNKNINNSLKKREELISKTSFNAQTIELNSIESWEKNAWEINHSTKQYFKVIGVRINSSNREVNYWDQPMFQDIGIGLIGLIVKKDKKKGVKFLIQLKAESGNNDCIHFAPTVSVSNYINNNAFYKKYFTSDSQKKIYDQLLSEEGGRFYQTENRYIIVEVNEEVRIQENFIWLNYAQIIELIKLGLCNIELRSLVSTFPL
tara:strand:- start:925 stop:2271 length:1347 start_codon:yes stop_codon:yes gene_type:complete